MSIFNWQAHDGQALWGDNLADEFGSLGENESGPQRDAAAGPCSASTWLADTFDHEPNAVGY